MDYKFNRGLLIGFILSGIGFMIDLECIGIGFLVLAFVWGILFVNPKSPIRSKYWSVGDKLGITVRQGKGNRQYLTIDKTLRVLSPMKVNKISLNIGRKKIPPLDWESYEIKEDESKYVNFDRPKWLRSGNHSARLIVYTPDGYSKSEVFTLEVRD